MSEMKQMRTFKYHFFRVHFNIVTYVLKARIMEAEEQPLQGNARTQQ
jgi:hypothetical protein